MYLQRFFFFFFVLSLMSAIGTYGVVITVKYVTGY